MRLHWAIYTSILSAALEVSAQFTTSTQSAADRSTPSTGVTNIPVYNATIVGTPADTTVVTTPDVNTCNYTSDDLYCFPYSNAFVTMTGWTRFFYNRNYGLINGSGLVDLTMYFAANDQPAATWIGLENTGSIPINVNISWFTSTLAPQATNSVADPYYFYVRPNSAVYNAFPTGSSRGPNFYAVQTPLRQAAQVVASSRPTTTSSASVETVTQTIAPNPASSGQSEPLSPGAKAGIALAAIALFFTIVILALLAVLYLRRQKLARFAAEAAQTEKFEQSRRQAQVPGNLYTAEELNAGVGISARGRPGLGATPTATRQISDSTTTTNSDLLHPTNSSDSVLDSGIRDYQSHISEARSVRTDQPRIIHFQRPRNI